MKIDLQTDNGSIENGDIIEYDGMVCMVVQDDIKLTENTKVLIVEIEEGHIIEGFSSLNALNKCDDIYLLAKKDDVILKFRNKGVNYSE